MGADHQGVRRAGRLKSRPIMRSVIRSLAALGVLLSGLLALAAPTTLAQSFPDRPVRLIAAFPPGGANDLVARLVAQSLAPRLGQPVVVENRPGSNGNVAGDVVAHAAPDGYTLLVGPSALFDINPHLYAHLSIDPLKDLQPVSTLVSDSLLLVENTGLPPKNFSDFIAYARAAKPPLLYGSIGNGSDHQMAMELLKQQAGIQMVHVPYLGGGPAALGVMAGQVAAMFGGGSVGALVKAGKLRALAISGRKRSPEFPDLPSISQFYPTYDVTLWQGLFAPAKTPLAVVARLHAATNAVLGEPGIAQRLRTASAGEPYVTTPDEFAARIRTDYERYGKVIAASGLRVE
jgi:tripartite-type tricarboxylate transporter receptor subunit TctC